MRQVEEQQTPRSGQHRHVLRPRPQFIMGGREEGGIGVSREIQGYDRNWE